MHHYLLAMTQHQQNNCQKVSKQALGCLVASSTCYLGFVAENVYSRDNSNTWKEYTERNKRKTNRWKDFWRFPSPEIANVRNSLFSWSDALECLPFSIKSWSPSDSFMVFHADVLEIEIRHLGPLEVKNRHWFSLCWNSRMKAKSGILAIAYPFC